MDDPIRLCERDGRLWFRGALSDTDLAAFEKKDIKSSRPGERLAASGSLRRALIHGPLSRVMSSLSPDLMPVRIVSFSKTSESNWSVPWHQDRVIAVRDRAEVEGFGNWSCKSGVWHCEPPIALLSRMLFIRVHLDDTDESNGAMQIARGSHAKGLVPASDAEAVAETFPHETCTAKRGDVQILKMLTLHRSRPSRTETPRRVYRIDYAAEGLSKPLDWLA